jgi:hypothetical protein
MSAKRKLKRSTRSKVTTAESGADKSTLRRQTSDERFKKPGSEKLWEALLGWDELRLRRIWLIQAVHDALAVILKVTKNNNYCITDVRLWIMLYAMPI